jgi:hypothetical protein
VLQPRGNCRHCGDADWRFDRAQDFWHCGSCGFAADPTDADEIVRAIGDAAHKLSTKRVASAINRSLVSPNEGDSNGEPANVVDGLFAIARALERGLDRVAEAIESRPVDPRPSRQPRAADPLDERMRARR